MVDEGLMRSMATEATMTSTVVAVWISFGAEMALTLFGEACTSMIVSLRSFVSVKAEPGVTSDLPCVASDFVQQVSGLFRPHVAGLLVAVKEAVST